MAQEFLKLIDKHFPIGHPLRSVVNRTTVKVSYRALPNMGAKIARHNAKILKNCDKVTHENPPTCNCRSKEDCPIPGACNQVGVIYQATVKNNRGKSETYIGLASRFKTRHYKHKASMETHNPENSTTLSTYFWKEREAGRQPCISWKITEKCRKGGIMQALYATLACAYCLIFLHYFLRGGISFYIQCMKGA